MPKPFRSFMEKIIDYAGLFPPARLPMDTAIHNYAEYREGTDSWMLSRFICPAARLRELKIYKEELFGESEPFHFSILIRSGKDRREFLKGFEKDLEILREFLDFNEGQVTAEVIEVRLPGDVLQQANPSVVSQFLNDVAAVIETKSPVTLSAFYEAGFLTAGKNWPKVLNAAIKGITEHKRYVQSTGNLQHYREAGFKLRCGGVEPQMYPSPEQVAAAIDACFHYRIALKATAGLHHPVRHFNKAARIHMHGFLNVFGAAVLAKAHHLSAEQIREIVEDEDATNFMFTQRAFAWKNLRASLDEIKKARSQSAISFGSCSFDEPREDLRALKFL
jgi:hypothetical protein